MRRVFAIREARIFFFGWTASQYGDWAMFFALAIWAKDLTHSNSAAGLIFFTLAAPTLFAPIAGVVVDRLPRRKVLIGVYSVEATGVLALLFVHNRGQLWILYAVTVMYGLASTFGGSARQAFMTVIIPRELLGDANGMFQTTREGLRLIAPLTGAAIYAAVGGGAVAILDSASFVCVVISLLLLRGVVEPKFEREETHFVTEVLAGARHILHTQALRQIVIACVIGFLVVGFSETTIFAVLQYGLHKPASFFGVLGSAQGVGAIVGGLTAAPAMRRIGDVKLTGIGVLAFSIGDFSFITSSLPLVIVGIGLAGAGVAWFIVGLITAVQTRTPPRLQGRVSSAVDLSANTPQTISIAVGAALIAIVNYRVLVLAEAVVLFGCGVYLATRRAVVATAEVPSAESQIPLQPLVAPVPDQLASATTAEPARDPAASGQT